MNSPQLTTLINTLANALAIGLTPNEIALLASILVQLGDTLASISAINAITSEAEA